jgi:hypothetical protein
MQRNSKGRFTRTDGTPPVAPPRPEAKAPSPPPARPFAPEDIEAALRRQPAQTCPSAKAHPPPTPQPPAHPDRKPGPPPLPSQIDFAIDVLAAMPIWIVILILAGAALALASVVAWETTAVAYPVAEALRQAALHSVPPY